MSEAKTTTWFSYHLNGDENILYHFLSTQVAYFIELIRYRFLGFSV